MRHKDCINYADERCLFKKKKVDPYGEACEYFEWR